MFLKKFDTISPHITLYFKGNNIHSSILSGILTIEMYIIIFVFGVYYALEFIHKKNPSAFFFNRYIEDAGLFPLNSSSMFHYINLRRTIDSSISEIDFDMIRIIGIEDVTIDNYPSIDLKNTRHWLYGLCNNKSDTTGIGYLITSDDYAKFACIRKFYEPNTHQYYDTNNKNFIWPILEHGMSNENHSFYGIIVEKCKNDDLRTISGLLSCQNSELIDEYVFSNVISIYLIDHYSDVLNYQNPFKKYLYSLSNMLFPNYFTVNNMNFNPAITKTHNGIFFDNIVEKLSYFFSLNEKVTMDEEMEVQDEDGNPKYDENGNKITKSTGIVSCYYFWMQNRLQYYERNYKRFQDIMSDIGGLSRVVFFITIFLNTLISDYIIMLDTEELSLSLKEKEKRNETRGKMDRKINLLINFPPRRVYYSNKHITPRNSINNIQQSSNLQRFIKGNENNTYENTYIEEKNDKINIKYKRNHYVNKKKNVYNIYQSNNYDKRKYEKGNNINNDKKSNLNIKYNMNIFEQKNNIYKNDEEEIFNQPNEKQNFTWFKYIKYILYCSRNNSAISFYEQFRAKILSEENIFQSYLERNKFFVYSSEK